MKIMNNEATVQKVKPTKDWKCNDCDKRMTLKQAEKVSFGTDGCLKCGGVDIDLMLPSEM